MIGTDCSPIEVKAKDNPDTCELFNYYIGKLLQQLIRYSGALGSYQKFRALLPTRGLSNHGSPVINLNALNAVIIINP